METSQFELDEQVERRTGDRDPANLLTPEVVALLKLCGGMRESDCIEPMRLEDEPVTHDRRHSDRRSGINSRRAGELPAAQPG